MKEASSKTMSSDSPARKFTDETNLPIWPMSKLANAGSPNVAEPSRACHGL